MYYQLGASPGMIFHDLWRNTEEVFEEPNYMTEVLGREASAYLTISARKLWTLTNSGQLACVRIGKAVRISRAALDLFIRANTHKGGAR